MIIIELESKLEEAISHHMLIYYSNVEIFPK